MEMPRILLSIVIVNWNTKDLLKDCLTSVFCETKDILFEVIVVDNGSTDDSVDMIKKSFQNVILVENRTNLGYSKANNQGIEHSRGEYVCLLNSDTIILDDAFRQMIKFLSQRPDIGAISCLQINPDGSDQFGTALGETNLTYMLSVETGLYKMFPKSRIWGKPRLSYFDHKKAHPLEVCPSAIMIIRKKVFQTVGLLDENIFFGAIDWDFSYRIRQKGWKLYFYPDVKIVHYGGMSKSPIRTELLLKDYRSQYYYFLKHYGIFKMTLFRLLITISSIIKIYANILAYIFNPNEILLQRYKRQLSHHLIRLRVSLSSLNLRKPFD